MLGLKALCRHALLCVIFTYLFHIISSSICLDRCWTSLLTGYTLNDLIFYLVFFFSRNNRFLIFVYRIIISEEFEYATHVVTVMYIFPMIIHLWPIARELNVSALTSINYYFMFLYTLESALKVLWKNRNMLYKKNSSDILNPLLLFYYTWYQKIFVITGSWNDNTLSLSLGPQLSLIKETPKD